MFSRKGVRQGKMNTLWTSLLASAAVVAILVSLLTLGRPDPGAAADKLVVYCAAGILLPVERIAAEYEDEYGMEIEIKFGGSNSLLAQIKVDKFSEADLYIAGDDYFTALACEEGLAAETLSVAHMRPVVAVGVGKESGITTFDDLLAEGVRLSVPDAEATALGRAIRDKLSAIDPGDQSAWSRLEKHVREHGVFKPTVPDVATDVIVGTVDAGIVWDATVAMPGVRDKLRAIPLAELEADPNLVSVAVLNSSPQPTAALKFARYLTARDRGLVTFEEFGLRPVEGDVWAERPSMRFFCGAVNRRAVDDIVHTFANREDVDIDVQYNGCGILTGQMKAISGQDPNLGFPDVYMACDVYYLENVKQWFQEAANVSDVEIVIAVPKGSDKVKSLHDLVKPGVRVSVGEPTQCTIGALTRRLLQAEGLWEKLKEKQRQDGEVVVEKSSSALLVPDAVTGHVDATVAYISDTLANRDKVDVVRMQSQHNLAIQPFSIARSSEHKHLGRRLFKRIAASPEAFTTAGFHFRLPQPSKAPGGDE
ncbi:MAG: extracellular solute-binding protein [Planctomycetes bacterium]|nr:extracellular solute-binding protein [Planctomycetota bacterium]